MKDKTVTVLLITTPPLPTKRPCIHSYDPADEVSPSLALAYLAGALRKAGHTVKVYDSALELYPHYSWEKFRKELLNIRSRLLGISVHATTSYPSALRIANFYKAVYPETYVILGGWFVSFLDLSAFQDSKYIDVVVRGEAERTVIELTNSLVQRTISLSEVKGITYREGDKVKFNEDQEFMKLDDLPEPAWDLFPMDKIKSLCVPGPGVPVMASRGCPRLCIFCSDRNFWRNSIRFRSVEGVISDIQRLIKAGIHRFNFNDNNFCENSSRAEAICRTMIDNKLDITWSADVRADCIQEKICNLMKKAGCTDVVLGIETGSLRILEYVRKGVTPSQIRKATEILNKAGVEIDATCIVGLPGENYDTFADTIEFVSSLRLNSICFYPFIPFPGCDVWYSPEKYGISIESYDWEKYIEPFVAVRTKELSQNEIKVLFLFARAYALKISTKIRRSGRDIENAEQIERGYLLR